MDMSYTWGLARKILLVFVALTIIASIAALFVRNSITKKLEGLTKLTIHVDEDQSKLEDVLLLLHLAENDFQEWGEQIIGHTYEEASEEERKLPVKKSMVTRKEP